MNLSMLTEEQRQMVETHRLTTRAAEIIISTLAEQWERDTDLIKRLHDAATHACRGGFPRDVNDPLLVEARARVKA
jgi:glycine cleavage system protein P-like pyridoxal-binding family